MAWVSLCFFFTVFIISDNLHNLELDPKRHSNSSFSMTAGFSSSLNDTQIQFPSCRTVYPRRKNRVLKTGKEV